MGYNKNMRRFFARFPLSMYRKVLHPRSLALSLTSGVVIGLMEVFYSISYASLIFAGLLDAHLSRGIGLALLSTLILLVIVTWLNSQWGVMAMTQNVPSVQMAVIAGYLMQSLQGPSLLPTVLVTIALATLLTGVLLVLLGHLKLGRMIRYFPYPVAGGFLAATGWLLVVSSFKTMAGYSLSIDHLSFLLQPNVVMLWIPGVLTGVVLLVGAKRVHHPLVIPFIMAGALILFYVLLLVSGQPLERAAQLGFFFQFSSNLSWQPLSLDTLRQADWMAILRVSSHLAVLMGMTLVGMLLNITAIELVINRESDINRDLRAAGLSNILAGLAGGMIGYQALGTTTINQRIAGKSRTAPLIAAAVVLGVILSGFTVLSYVPKFLVGGVLLYLGLDFLYDWLFTGWIRFALREFAIVVVILITIVMTDFLTGVMVGTLATVVMFAISYSQTRVIARSYTCAEMRSMLNRSWAENGLLHRYGQDAYILELQGFLFFGTANTLVDNVKNWLFRFPAGKQKYLLIDFRQVTGIDSSAALSFRKIRQLMKERGAILVLSDITIDIQKRLQIDDQVFPNLDRGLEWLEDQILAQYNSEGMPPPVDTLPLNLIEPINHIPEEYYSIITAAPGEVIIQKGDPADCLYLLLQGVVSIYLDHNDPHKNRINSFGPGCIVGEVGLYLNMPRTAYVVVDEPACLMRFTREAIQTMSEKDPVVALAFRDFIIRQMSDRMMQNDQSIAALRR